MSGDGFFGVAGGALATLRRWGRALLAVVGTAALLLALAVSFTPWLIPGFVVDGLLEPMLANRGLVVAGAAVLVVVVFYDMVMGLEEGAETSVRVPTPPAAVDPDRSEVDTPGDWVDERLATVGGEDDDGESRVGIAIVKKRVNERLTELAVDVLTDTHSCTRLEAHRMLEDATWTDRRRAQVYLGGPDVRGLSLSTRLRDWASGEAYERQVQATVEELAEMAGVDVGESIAPEPATFPETATDAVDRATAGDVDLREVADALGAEGVDPGGLYRPEMFDDGDGEELDLTAEAAAGSETAPEPATEAAASSGGSGPVQADGAGDGTAEPSRSPERAGRDPTGGDDGNGDEPTDDRETAVETGGERT